MSTVIFLILILLAVMLYSTREHYWAHAPTVNTFVFRPR